MHRSMEWPGLPNARDLGGLPLTSGGQTLAKSVFRSNHPRHTTEEGWQSIWADGVRTIIRLTTSNLNEEHVGLAPPPAGIRIVEVPVEDFEDQEFKARWIDTKLWCSSLYYPDAIQRWPGMLVNALRAIADANRGVLIHCQAGRDRTGLICALLLASVGVTHDAIIADYLQSFRHMPEAERHSLDAALLSRSAALANGLEALLATAGFWKRLEAHGLDDELRRKLHRCLRGEGSQSSKH